MTATTADPDPDPTLCSQDPEGSLVGAIGVRDGLDTKGNVLRAPPAPPAALAAEDAAELLVQARLPR